MAEDLSKGNRRDPGWKYNHLQNPNDTTRVTCNFCGKTTRGGINRAKQHLIGNFRNAAKCLNCPQEVRDELRNYMEEKKLRKEVYTNEFSGFDEFDYQDDVGGEDEVQETIHKKRGGESFPSSTSKKLAKGKGPMDVFLQRQGTLRQANIKDSCDKEARAMTIQKVARFFYDNGIPFNVARSKVLRKQLRSVGRYGPNLKPPMFMESIDASSFVKTGEKLCELLDRYVERVGEQNVVQVISDNGSNFVLAGQLLQRKRRHIYWTPCAAHCIDLMLEDIGKIPNIKKTLQRAIALVGFIYGHSGVLNMMRDSTKNKELVKCGITRFATSFLTLQRSHCQKTNLRAMFTSDKWMISRWSKLPKENL
ncbi:uncharacterized protein LOC132035933 [Lycium ferocissimum]|uniref:uncharacterized protein LOC132035933 n=1 Tax=Lycium ferocissimum TaxID=112874 RepID=UPI0028149796|nr:uncharacterized protein LOC132035933 [Lycium ferocissimum]